MVLNQGWFCPGKTSANIRDMSGCHSGEGGGGQGYCSATPVPVVPELAGGTEERREKLALRVEQVGRVKGQMFQVPAHGSNPHPVFSCETTPICFSNINFWNILNSHLLLIHPLINPYMHSLDACCVPSTEVSSHVYQPVVWNGAPGLCGAIGHRPQGS